MTLPTNAPAGVPILTARPVTAAVAAHGEGPVWHPSFAGVRWVDMHAGDVLELVGPDAVERHHVGTVAAAFRPRRGGGVVLADQRGFVLLRDDLTVERRLPDLWDDPGVRMNEGGADPDGNFWCGSMAYDESPGAGALYRLTPDLQVTTVLEGVTISNGLGFSPDGGTAYYVDTPTGRVDAFDFRGGELTGRRPVVEIDGPGAPDGLTVDAEGCLWVALFDGAAVHRYSPDGTLLAVVPLPAAQVTAAAFGGPDLDRLYVTTSREGLDDAARAEQPLAGALFTVDVPGVTGLPVLEFAG